MSPDIKGRVPGLTSPLRRVSLNPSHYRSGRWFVLAQGVVVSALGLTGIVSSAVHSHAPANGAPVLGLASTYAHGGLLLGFGVLASLSALRRRTAVMLTAAATAVFFVLVIIGGVAAAHATPGPLGSDPADIVLHAVVAAVNLASLMWLIPDLLEGPEWIRRLDNRQQEPVERGAPR
jgi:Domain of unknown function (DUF4383)